MDSGAAKPKGANRAAYVGYDGEGTVIRARGIESLLRVSVPEKRKPYFHLLLRVAKKGGTARNPSPLRRARGFIF